LTRAATRGLSSLATRLRSFRRTPSPPAR
jgi:hypothetical protein